MREPEWESQRARERQGESQREPQRELARARGNQSELETRAIVSQSESRNANKPQQ